MSQNENKNSLTDTTPFVPVNIVTKQTDQINIETKVVFENGKV